MTSLYEADFYAWANQQAALLRAGKLSSADIAHIAEEIEGLGTGEKRELVSRLTVLLLHSLKWRFQPGLRGNGWRDTIKVQRLAGRNGCFEPVPGCDTVPKPHNRYEVAHGRADQPAGATGIDRRAGCQRA